MAGLSLENDEPFVLLVLPVRHRPGKHSIRPGALLPLLSEGKCWEKGGMVEGEGIHRGRDKGGGVIQGDGM